MNLPAASRQGIIMGLLIIFSALVMRNSALPCPSPDGLSAFWRIKKIHVRFMPYVAKFKILELFLGNVKKSTEL